ncbi:LacI family DNA-binding transcriptional regulator [Amedibacillus sp. YH-ame6]
MKVTIKDIAKEVNVSVSTVSLVLNEKPCRVSKDTRTAILNVAKKYNYQVNQAARSLVTKRSNIIGIIIPDIENLFFSSLCKKLEECCLAKGYMLIIVNSNDKEEEDLRLLNMLVSRGVDGIFITPSNEALVRGERLPQALENLTTPYVVVDRPFENMDACSVSFDNKEGAQLAIAYLIEKGHTKIGCIGSRVSANHNGSTRVQGYLEAMKHAGLEVYDRYIFEGNYRHQDGYEAGVKIMESDLTAVFICNDMMTLGFIQCLSDYQKTYPKDYSIISYDNMINPYIVGDKITAVSQNVMNLAQTSCELMFDLIKHKEVNKKNYKLKPELIEGKSVLKRK